MAALPYMQFYVAEYLADTTHLNAEQHGAYLLLLMNYWQRGKPLPDSNDRLAIVSRSFPDRWNEMREVLSEFFEIKDGFWIHNRVERDLLRVKGVSDAGKKAGIASGKARKQKTSNDRSENVQRNVNETSTKDEPTEQNRTEQIKNSLLVVNDRPEEFANIWNSGCGKDLPRVTKFTDSRKKKVRQRMGDGLTLSVFYEVVRLCVSSNFLTGKEGAWKASFDWIMENDKNWVKVREGNYTNKSGNGTSHKSQQRGQEINDTIDGFNEARRRIFGEAEGCGQVQPTGALSGQVRPLLESSTDNAGVGAGVVRGDPAIHGQGYRTIDA